MDVGIEGYFVGRPFFALPERELQVIARRVGYRQSRLALALHITSRTAQRYFHERFGCSPCDWLAQLRACDAKVLLASGSSIKQVAHAISFRHVPSFYREFRRWAGCTPAEYVEMTADEPCRDLWRRRVALSESAKPLSLPPLECFDSMRGVSLFPQKQNAGAIAFDRATRIDSNYDDHE